MSARKPGFAQRKPRLFDALVALFWTLLSFASDDVWLDRSHLVYMIPFILVIGLSLYWRRRYALQVFVLASTLILISTWIDVDDPVPMAFLCATYSLGAYTTERRHSIAALTALIVLGFVSILITSIDHIGDVVVIALTLGIAFVIGDSLRTRRAYQQSILERAERAEALRDSLAHQAVAEERTRIARDLHDVVAHSMSLMVVQAGAARRVAKTDPDAAAQALQAIENVGRNSLDEMRRILGVLRGDDAGSGTAPQPDIAALEPLADEFRAAGLPVTITHKGDHRPLPPSIELTAFRIVQESLTNILKHAGPASAEVRLDYSDTHLHIAVEDDGRLHASAIPAQPGSQKGHVGMRERVAAFGGAFRASPRLDGGYVVTATLPLAAVDQHNLDLDEPAKRTPDSVNPNNETSTVG